MEQLTTSELSSVLEAWKNVNFPNVLETYGKKGEEIIENQKSSLQGRKELAENTKAFRKNTTFQDSTELKVLLKGYQNEIDKLTKKLRFAENTYLNLYKIMSELPNPELYLAQQLEDRRKKTKENKKEETLKLDNKKLLQENKELKETIAQIRQEQENFLKDSQNTQQQQQGEYENQISYLKNRELSLQQQLTEAVHNLEHLRSTHDLTQSELPDITTNKDQEMLAKLAEFDVNQAELDRANLRINDLQLVVAKLKSQIQSLEKGVETNEMILDYQNKVKTLELQLNKLSLELEASKIAQGKNLREVEELESVLELKANEIKKLLNKLEEQNDYAEIKRELEILKSVELGGDWDEEKPKQKDVKLTFEQQLIKQNQNLQTQLTLTKNKSTQFETETQSLKSQVSQLSTQLKAKSDLVLKLEHDLSSSTVDVNKNDNNSTNNSILPIVTSQRDRFKQRTTDLEDQLRKAHSLNEQLLLKADKLQAENSNLIGQLKSLKSINSFSTPSAINIPTPTTSTRIYGFDGFSDDYAYRYSSRHRLLSPFLSKSKTNRYFGAIKRFTRNLMRYKYTRHLVYLYISFLHLFVFYLMLL